MVAPWTLSKSCHLTDLITIAHADKAEAIRNGRNFTCCSPVANASRLILRINMTMSPPLTAILRSDRVLPLVNLSFVIKDLISLPPASPPPTSDYPRYRSLVGSCRTRFIVDC